MTIPASVVSSVQRLLAAGEHSQRKIAILTGVSRGSVRTIAKRRHPRPNTSLPRPRSGRVYPSGPYVKCKGCGALVQKPCLVCERRRHPVPRIYSSDRDTESDLDLEIREPDAHQRQQALAAQKRLAGEFPARLELAIDDQNEGPTDEQLREIEREGQ